jgi:hypothetical protein
LNGIVWIISKNANGDAVLQAFPAGNLSLRLYTSEQLPTRDRSGGYVKFSVPTVADGKVFVGTSNSSRSTGGCNREGEAIAEPGARTSQRSQRCRERKEEEQASCSIL